MKEEIRKNNTIFMQQKEKFERKFRDFSSLSNERENNMRMKQRLLQDEFNSFIESRSDIHYFKYYSSLVIRLKGLYECPLSLSQLTAPVILPSGTTIQDSFFDELIKNNNIDPYNKNLRIRQRIVNRFAKNVMEIINEIEKEVVDEGLKIEQAYISQIQNNNTADASFQAELFTRSEDDIALIEKLKIEISDLKLSNKELIQKIKIAKIELHQSEKLRNELNRSIKCLFE